MFANRLTRRPLASASVSAHLNDLITHSGDTSNASRDDGQSPAPVTSTAWAEMKPSRRNVRATGGTACPVRARSLFPAIEMGRRDGALGATSSTAAPTSQPEAALPIGGEECHGRNLSGPGRRKGPDG